MNKDNCTIRLERPEEQHEVENLVREAFWNVYRPGCLEHYVLHCCRSHPDFVPELNLVLEQDGELIGHVMYVRARLTAADGRVIPVMTFGPLSILPKWQGKGYGRLLLDASMEKARAMGAAALCIEGDIGFYGRSGFVPGWTLGIDYAEEPAGAQVPYFLVKELTPGSLAGVRARYHTPACYFVDEAQAEEFDKRFPPKTKRVQDGQL